MGAVARRCGPASRLRLARPAPCGRARRSREVRGWRRELRPDVVHVHNLFPLLSPAVLRTAAAPVVVTLHNYRLLCLPAMFLRDGRPVRTASGSCRGAASSTAATAARRPAAPRWPHRSACTGGRGRSATSPMFLAVSEFVRDKHVEAGFDPARIRVKPNFVAAAAAARRAGRDFLFLGRLSAEKGLDRLVSLWRDVPGRLVVVGDGPERARLEALAPRHGRVPRRVPPDEVPAYLSRARALVLPSICYEGAPRTVVEAYAAGVPVVANRHGALPSVVTDDVTGLLVDPATRTAGVTPRPPGRRRPPSGWGREPLPPGAAATVPSRVSPTWRLRTPR